MSSLTRFSNKVAQMWPRYLINIQPRQRRQPQLDDAEAQLVLAGFIPLHEAVRFQYHDEPVCGAFVQTEFLASPLNTDTSAPTTGKVRVRNGTASWLLVHGLTFHGCRRYVQVLSQSKKIRAAIVGAGFMGRVHTEGVRRLGNVEIAAIAAETAEEAARFAASVGIDRSTGDYRELMADPAIDVVHICTPNHLHFPIGKAALGAGKHVICEKPLATSVADGTEMAALAKKTGLAACTLHNIRAYPQARNIRAMIAAGEVGEVWAVQGTYSQDWLLYDSDWNWRIEIGPSRTFADIGSHWCDLVEFVTGLRITEVCAELNTFHKTRRKPKGQVETFSGKTHSEYQETAITTEDFGSMIFHLGERARGAMTVSQISAGRKNRLVLEIYGTKAGVAWDAERPDELWIGHRGAANQLLIKDPALLHKEAAGFADLPGGHSEGFDDTFKQTFKRFYARVADPNAPIEYPTFEDGLRQLRILEAVLESSGRRAWIEVKE